MGGIRFRVERRIYYIIHVYVFLKYIILVGCAQTAAVGDPMEVVGLLFFCALKFVRLLIQV